jgi:hypothetical protein
MLRTFATSTLAALLFAGSAYAQTAAYSWTGYGVNVPGSSKCASYKMTINVTVAGDSVKAKFLQEGRTERHFEATKDAKGNFQTSAMLGAGNAIQVSGVINGPESKVLLDGYCKFGGPLLPK